MLTKDVFYLPARSNCTGKEIDFLLSEFKDKNVAKIDVIGDTNALISEKEFKHSVDHKKFDHIYEVIISNFKKISSNYDHLIVYGNLKDFHIVGDFALNVEISKNLNIPIIYDYVDDNELIGFNHMVELYNGKALGGIKDQILSYTDNKKYSNLLEALNEFKADILTPINFQSSLVDLARKDIKCVVLPESDDERILKASDALLKLDALNLILLGNKDEVNKKANELNLDLSKARIIDPKDNEYLSDFANKLYELRKAKGMELEKAKKLVTDRTYFGTMLVSEGIADAMVSGASTTTAETIRPALQIIKTKPGIKTVSGAFLMCLDTKMVVFADCAVVPNPSAEDLASIAISSAQTASSFGLTPKVAMLTYSSGDSGCGPDVDLIKEATKLVKELDPNILVDGPLQFDAAYDKVVAKKKMPNSPVAGEANVFIFPDLSCGNICYKAVQRTAGAVAIGPLLQGLKKPVNDLSRGCLVEDIINTVLISALQK